MFTPLGYAWRRYSMRLASASARLNCVPRPPLYSCGSTKFSGTRNSGSMLMRLMAPDMWTGWGIRTLSADHAAFNPYNYQTGSVWPHDNAIIAIGFKRYGFHTEAARIAHDVSVAASHFLLNQLPELYTASERNESNFPV